MQATAEAMFRVAKKCTQLPIPDSKNAGLRMGSDIKNLAKLSAWSRASLALYAINNTCFRGGTGNHPQKYQTAIDNMNKCWAIIKFNNRKYYKSAPSAR